LGVTLAEGRLVSVAAGMAVLGASVVAAAAGAGAGGGDYDNIGVGVRKRVEKLPHEITVRTMAHIPIKYFLYVWFSWNSP